MAEVTKFELVVCIVNAGFSQVVVEAARKAGARGGTIIRGRGSANPEAEEFFGVTIQPDKEIVLTLVPTDIKDEVLRTIYQESGLSKEGQGIAFTVPVERATAIRTE
jgi:nitrogen regulatory protein PII